MIIECTTILEGLGSLINGIDSVLPTCRLVTDRQFGYRQIKSPVANSRSQMPNNNENRWRKKTYEPTVQNAPERQEHFITESGMQIEPVYSPPDINQDARYQANVGYPGEFPFTRGIQPTMYRGRLWTMRQYSGYSTPEESNTRFQYLLSQGQTGLSVAFDLPTQTGYDSDHEMAQGEVGKVGVPISSLLDMEELFRDIPLDQVTTSMTINATAPILLALYLAVAEKQGVAFKNVGGTTQNDVLKEYIARGTYIFPPDSSLRLTTDVIAFCAAKVPRWNTISISGYHMREAGGTAIQELAFTLANAKTYVKAAISAGLHVDEFADRLSFFFASHNNLFEEVAKFRAARRMWARIMKHEFGAKNERSHVLRFHTQTAGVTLTAQQHDNNVVRTTVQGLAAILGGTQSLHINSRDEALGLPTEESARLALRTQQVLANESGITDTIDPMGGSYYVEYLTDYIEAEASKYLDTIAGMGGAVPAIDQGFQKREIENSAYLHHQLLESDERIVVGVNAYVGEEEMEPDILSMNEERARQQIHRVKLLRNERDNESTEHSLRRLEQVASIATENTIPAILDCVKAYATLGEICNSLRDSFGEYQPPKLL